MKRGKAIVELVIAADLQLLWLDSGGKMTNTIQAYDNLTPYYHLIFQDWHSAIKRQSGIISKLLPSPQEAGPVLDCACGIGTQALGLAAIGYEVEGTDISPGEVERAQQEAANLGLNASFRADDGLCG